jgi:hypothetical protein
MQLGEVHLTPTEIAEGAAMKLLAVPSGYLPSAYQRCIGGTKSALMHILM